MEIENVLCKYSGVDKCAVVGRHNGEKGYLVIAYVTLKSKDIGENVETELRQLCRQELKENSWPIEYHFVENCDNRSWKDRFSDIGKVGRKL